MIQNVSLDFESLNPQLASNLKRNINRLNESNIATRREASKQILNIVSTQQLSPSTFQEIAQLNLKSLLKAFADDSEVVRETSVKTVIELLTRCEEINQFLPFILSVLVERTNCIDLEGIANLPEVMRPPPGQKPKIIVRLQEQSEEIRSLYCRLMQKILGLTEAEVLRNYLDDVINIIRTFVMDPCGDIQKEGCETLQILCKSYKNILLNYTQTMGKAILLPLISKKSKIRIAALEALNSVFKCGLWKYNAFVFEDLIGFRDPNSVPIKDFYSPTTHVNYLATLIIDPNVRVRQAFMKCLHEWICVLEDKYDHHGKLVPYVLSGLFDEDAGIRKIAYDAIQEIGQQIQVEKQKDFRQNKQFGVDAAWTWDGKMKDMPIIDPFISRPRLGSRFFIRGHIRKLWPALLREIQDINVQNRLRAVKLALMGVIYAENHMTTHMDKFIPHFITAISSPNKQDVPICQIVSTIFYYLGRYCEYSAYIHIIKSGIKGELVQNPQFIKCTFKALAKLTEGNLECVPKDTGLCHKKASVYDTLNMLTEFQLFNEISSHNSAVVEEFMLALLNGLKRSASQSELNEIMDTYFTEITKVFFIIYYEKYLGGSLNLTSTKEISTKLPESDKSFEFIQEQTAKRKQLLQEFLNDIFRNPPSFGDSNWKFVIVYYIFLLKTNAPTAQIETVLDVISESLQNNRLPEMADSTLKIALILLNDSNLAKSENLATMHKLVLSCGENLLKYKPIKKVPKYMEAETKQQKQQDPEIIKTPDYVFHAIFEHLSSVLETMMVKNVQLTQEQSAGLIYCYVWSTAKIRKQKDLIQKSVRVVWTFLQRIDVKTWAADKFKYEGKYILPIVIDYLVERIETMESGTQHSNLVLGAFIRVGELFPDCKGKTAPLPYHYPNYPDLLERLFKYALDQKDAETKTKFSELLLTLCKRMTEWFKVELEMARSKGRFEREKLLESVLAYCHK